MSLEPKSKKQEMILRSTAQVTLIGGAAASGKSYMLQMMPLMYADDPNTRCIMFRRTTPQLTGQGGIWEIANEMYNTLPVEHKPKFTVKPYQAKFPSGATVRWQHMELVRNKLDIQGLQFTFIGVDEACQFEWEQLEYMMSRLRSKSKYPSRLVMSCNPDPDHKLRELIEGFYLDEEGYPIPEKDGVIRYFIRKDGNFFWGDTREELGEKYDIPKNKWDSKILSFTFISANIYDNPVCIEENPEYLAWLEGLNEIDKAQLLHGNWFMRPKGASYWQRGWLTKLDHQPKEGLCARAWDKASQEPTQVEKQPDFTANVKMWKTKDERYVIVGDYIEDNRDNGDTNTYGRFRKGPGERDRIIRQQGLYDGEECTIVLPVDPGAAGKVEFQESAKKLIAEGLLVKQDPSPTTKSKLNKFTPFAVACENGLVSIVESSFRDNVTLEAFYKEMESFTGERSTRTKKDDWPDSMATAFNYLASKRVVNIVRRNQASSPSRASTVIAQHEIEVKEKEQPYRASV